MQPVFKRKLKLLLTICVISSLSGVVYQFIDVDYIDFKSIYLGFGLGLSFGILELFILTKYQHHFQRLPFFWHLVIKSILYTIIILIVAESISLILELREAREKAGLFDTLLLPGFYSLIIYTLIMYTLLVFYLQVNRMLGEGVLIKFLWGRYYKPVEEERIFMFLDMKSSTTIAEQLGHQRYYAWLDNFFHEITKPVLKNKAEIYQYVGDEVVFTWKTKNGIKNLHCLEIFFDIKERIDRKHDKYREKYGVIPKFKAGVHFGNVITAKIGDLKRVIVYNGDVLNTTSRIQERCNKYNCELLISGSLLEKLELGDRYRSTFIKSAKLRGKKTKIDLYCVKKISLKSNINNRNRIK
jgi:adenylate cyclase